MSLARDRAPAPTSLLKLTLAAGLGALALVVFALAFAGPGEPAVTPAAEPAFARGLLPPAAPLERVPTDSAATTAPMVAAEPAPAATPPSAERMAPEAPAAPRREPPSELERSQPDGSC